MKTLTPEQQAKLDAMDAAQEVAKKELMQPAVVNALEPMTLHDIVAFIKRWRGTAGYGRLCNLLIELDNQLHGG